MAVVFVRTDLTRNAFCVYRIDKAVRRVHSVRGSLSG
jgi:hypothetical protein